jgi:outer membrane receptor protein involved in Fe transport
MDNFKDLPTGDNIAFMNRWAYQGTKMEAQFGFNAYQDRKVGGQIGFVRGMQLEPNPQDFKYGVLLNSKHIDAFLKTGFFGKRTNQSLGIVYNVKYQEINGSFGIRNFSGVEKRGYINVIYDDYIGTLDHKIKTGASLVVLDISQSAEMLMQNRKEIVPGIFTEYTYTNSRLSSVLGARYDYHSLYGSQFSPRVHAKFIAHEKTDLRFTAGKGWRVPNYIIDNVSLLANSKQWIAPNEIKPEISWNIGGSVVQEFKLFNQKGSLTVDLYRTWFENQLIVDRDESVNAIVFTNLENGSFSNSFQSELSVSPLKNFDIRVAYKYLDVKAQYGGALRQQVMIPKHRGFVNLAYFSRNKRWEYDLTCTAYGISRLPVQEDPNNPSNQLFDQTSEVYPMLNAQITHVFKRWDFYLGGENLSNFKQKNPIIDAQNPFGSKFDATTIWGPVMGVNIYAGLRYSIKQKK